MTTDEKLTQNESDKPATETSPAVSISVTGDSTEVPNPEEATASPAEQPAAPTEPAEVTAPVAAPPVADDSPPTLSVAETLAASSPQTIPTAPAPTATQPEPTQTATTSPVETAPTPEIPTANTAVPTVSDTNADSVTETESKAPAPAAPAADGPAARIREKLGAGGADKPVGSEDIKSQRPETPTNTVPIDIPESDELDSALESEISNALGSQTAPPAAAVSEGTPVADGAEIATPSAEEQEEIGPGSRIKGTVQHIHGDDVFLNAGLLADVVVSLKQFPADKQPSVGDSLDVVIDNIDGDGLFRARLPETRTKTGGNWDGLAAGQVVDCQVTATNKGGLQVTVSSIKGFLPASQVDLGYVSNLEEYVGQTLTVKITEVKPKKKNLVVSRRAILQEERESAQAGFWETLEVGNDLPGTVKTLKNYGAFVNLGPIDGFLHVGEISWSRINHPNEVLKEGQEIQVRVLKIDREKDRISLGMKQMVQNPWQNLGEKYPSERIVSGKVTRVADFGAFVELEPGVEGLVHISELAWRRVGSVAEVLKVGDEKEFKVLEVDPKRKRVSLSLKALEQKPETEKTAEAEIQPRKENLDLRGGMGGGKAGGGLFGNPSDFT